MKNLIISARSVIFIFFGTLLLIAPPSYAFVALEFDVDVIDHVSQTGPNQWEYQYSITNNSECTAGFCLDTMDGIPVEDTLRVIDFYIPYFEDAGIDLSGILSPASWSVTVDSSLDLFNLGNGAGVMHWSTTFDFGLPINTTLDGFGYTAEYSGAKGPFQAEFIFGSPFIGDPLIPASPNAIAAGLSPVSSVPIPTAILLFVSGIFGLAGVKIGRK
jgi:hypothetical protein